MNKFKLKEKISFVFLLLVIALVGITAWQVQKVKSLNSKASGNVSLYFSENSFSLPPDQDVILYMNTNMNNVSYVRFRLNYNPSAVKLIAEPVLTSSNILNKIIDQTSMTEANISGKAYYVLAVKYDSANNPANGTIPLIRMRFTPNTSLVNIQSPLTLDSVEVVGSDASDLSFTTGDAAFKINTLTPTVTPTVTPTSIPTSTPISTVTPKPTITSTPIQTATPNPSLYPSITILSPADNYVVSGDKLTIATMVTSVTKMKSILIYMDSKLIKSCGTTSVCSMVYNAKVLARGWHTLNVVATNISGYSKSLSVKIYKP